MRILIATPTYPPDHGGPAYYAKSIEEELEKLGHDVVVRTYTVEHALPSGIRHLIYFLKTFPAYFRADMTIVLDTFSVGFPVAMMRALFGGIVLLRIGGDFLWEWYVERTKEKILLSDFYTKPRQFTLKEKIIFRLTRFVLRRVSRVIFSTAYQRDIWVKAYGIPPKRVAIIENRFEPANVGAKLPRFGSLAPTDRKPLFSNSRELENKTGGGGEGGDTGGLYDGVGGKGQKVFVYAAARDLVLKNTDITREAFALARRTVPDIKLESLFDVPRDEAIEKIKNAHAVILTSLGDISPNYILRALSFGIPVILTKENGLRERLGDAVIYVDPLDAQNIADAIIDMCAPATHADYRRRVAELSFTHTYADIAGEFISLYAS